MRARRRWRRLRRSRSVLTRRRSPWLTGQSTPYTTHTIPDRAEVHPSMDPSPSAREVVIVEAARTPIGRGHPEKGYYRDTHPNELLGKTFTEVIERAGIEASDVEDVVTGCVQQYGE